MLSCISQLQEYNIVVPVASMHLNFRHISLGYRKLVSTYTKHVQWWIQDFQKGGGGGIK